MSYVFVLLGSSWFGDVLLGCCWGREVFLFVCLFVVIMVGFCVALVTHVISQLEMLFYVSKLCYCIE